MQSNTFFSKMSDTQLIAVGGSLIAFILVFVPLSVEPLNVSGQVATSTTTGLVGKWIMDEGIGTTTADTSGKRETGKLLGGSTWVQGEQALGVHFDGVDDRIEIANATSLNIKTNITVTLWAKRDARMATATTSKNAKLLQKGLKYSDVSYGIVDRSDVSGAEVPQFRVKVNNKIYTIEGATTSLPVGVWRHIAGVRNGKTMSLYIDGKLVASKTIPTTTITTNTFKLYLGDSAGDTDGAFGGTLDDVRIYNRALSTAEIQAVRAEAIPSAPVAGPKILPLGDSITRAGADLPTSFRSYRKYLIQKLNAAGIPFDNVGTVRDTGVPWDPDQEGHAGWESWEIRDALPSWLQAYTPDIVLLHIGTNDLVTTVPDQGSKTPDEVIDSDTSIIQILRAKNPRVKIVLAKIMPARIIPDALIMELNDKLGALASSTSTTDSPVITADMFTNFDKNSYFTDDLHPNAAGAAFIADQWFAALKSLGL